MKVDRNLPWVVNKASEPTIMDSKEEGVATEVPALQQLQSLYLLIREYRVSSARILEQVLSMVVVDLVAVQHHLDISKYQGAVPQTI